MKYDYESPSIEVFSFYANDVVMDTCSDCPSFGCPADGVCISDVGCITDGGCVLDGQCILDGVSGY